MPRRNPLETLGQTIRTLRTKREWSQEELAVRAGLDRTYVGGVERGERNLSILNLIKIADALGVGVDHLVRNLP
jgi:transcriptional regulator with XRE-family HTH domain